MQSDLANIQSSLVLPVPTHRTHHNGTGRTATAPHRTAPHRTHRTHRTPVPPRPPRPRSSPFRRTGRHRTQPDEPDATGRNRTPRNRTPSASARPRASASKCESYAPPRPPSASSGAPLSSGAISLPAPLPALSTPAGAGTSLTHKNLPMRKEPDPLWQQEGARDGAVWGGAHLDAIVPFHRRGRPCLPLLPAQSSHRVHRPMQPSLPSHVDYLRGATGTHVRAPAATQHPFVPPQCHTALRPGTAGSGTHAQTQDAPTDRTRPSAMRTSHQVVDADGHPRAGQATTRTPQQRVVRV